MNLTFNLRKKKGENFEKVNEKEVWDKDGGCGQRQSCQKCHTVQFGSDYDNYLPEWVQ